MDGPTEVQVRAAEIARTCYGRLVALLAVSTRDLALAEDVLADAFERALRTWPAAGVPDNPEAWLLDRRPEPPARRARFGGRSHLAAVRPCGPPAGRHHFPRPGGDPRQEARAAVRLCSPGD